MSDEPAPVHMRPFFPSVQDFAAATAPHFAFLVDQFNYVGPSLEEQTAETFDIVFYGGSTVVLLVWEVSGGFFACHLIPRLRDGSLDPDGDHWLAPNEILGARGAQGKWVTQEDLEDVDAAGFARAMERAASNLRNYCSDVLRGDWSIYEKAHRWFDGHLHD
jgi:hypothetical protein